MSIKAEDIFKSLEKLGVRKGFPFRSEPIPQRDEEERLLLRARGMTAGSGMWSTDIFSKQAQFLERFEPEMRDFVPCENLPGSYDSPYNLLAMSQLKYYFSWRAAFRNGQKARCDGGYADLYFRETLAGFGAAESERIGLWCKLLREYPDLPSMTRDRLKAAIIDQYAVSGDDMPFWLRMAEKGLDRHDFGPFYEYDQRLLPGSFAFALKRTNYDPRKGKYFQEKDLPRLEKAYDAACQAAFDLLASRKVKGEIVLWGRTHKDKNWKPLYVAYARYQSPKVRRTGDVVISATEKYVFKRGESSLHRASLWNAHLAVVLGYLLKRCEARMRIYDKYRYRLNPSPETFRKDLFHSGLRYKQFSELLDSGEFDRVVDAAIDASLKPAPIKPKKVEVDFSRLADIRRDADIVRAELTVAESELHDASPIAVKAASVMAEAAPIPAKASPTMAEAAPIAAKASPVLEEAAPFPAASASARKAESSNPQFARANASPMEQFVAALTDAQAQALIHILQGKHPETVTGGMMAQVFWEEINEHSLDILGDTVYNAEEACIYEDYADELKDALGI